MIVFKKIRFKNFISTGNQFNEIIFNQHERTLVSSSNGSGKSSSCIDSIVFALFGKAHRNINKNQLINSTNEKDLLVELWFSIGNIEYKIQRGLKPNIFDIFINDEKQNTLSNVKDMQAFLETDILKMNYNAFVNIAILSSSNFIPFMEQPIATRRLLVEELLDINIFGIMLTLLKERIKIVNNEIKDFKYQIASLNKQIEIQVKLISSITTAKETSIEDNQTKISDIEKNIDTIKLELKQIAIVKDKLLLELPKLLSFKDLNGQYSNYTSAAQNKIRELNKTLLFYQQHDVCPTCEQSLQNIDKEQYIITCNKKINDLTIGVSKLLQKQKESSEKIIQLTDIQNKISKIDKIQATKFCQIQFNIDSINKYKTPTILDNQSLEEELKNLQNLQDSIIQYNSDMDLANIDLQNYQIILHMLSDNGIKSKIIDKYLPLFNKYINNYLEIFGVYINFIFDNTFKESIKSRYRDLFSYSSFSEGEKIKISLAIMLAFRDLARLKNSVNTNLLIMDEIFDSSLDFESNKSLMNILRSMVDTNIIIISHRNDLKEDDFDRILHFRKEHNFSIIDSVVA